MYRIYSQTNNKSFPEASKEHIIQITFKDESFIGVANGQNTYGTLIGYLNNEFEYSAKGNYTDVFNISKVDSLAVKLLEDTVQRNIANYGILTKKMYTNGESPTLTVNFRCWAGDGENIPSYVGSKINDKNERVDIKKISNPVIVANALINATMPRVESKSVLMNSNVVDTTIQAAKALGGIIANTPIVKVGETVFSGDFTAEKALENVKQGAIAIKDTLSDFLSKKPPVCSVKIGNIFEKDMMVVASVDIKFSKEYFSEGVPLYGDYNVTLQSLFTGSVNDSMGNMNIDKEKIFGSGLNQKTSSRVTFDDTALEIEMRQPDPLKVSPNTFPGIRQ